MIFELMCKYPHLVSPALLVSSLASKASLPALKVSSGVFSSSRQGRQGGKQQGEEQGEGASLPSGGQTETEWEARQRQTEWRFDDTRVWQYIHPHLRFLLRCGML